MPLESIPHSQASGRCPPRPSIFPVQARQCRWLYWPGSLFSACCRRHFSVAHPGRPKKQEILNLARKECNIVRTWPEHPDRHRAALQGNRTLSIETSHLPGPGTAPQVTISARVPTSRLRRFFSALAAPPKNQENLKNAKKECNIVRTWPEQPITIALTSTQCQYDSTY